MKNRNFSALRKSLSVQVGEEIGNQIADLLQEMLLEIEELKRSKVTVTRFLPNLTHDDEDPIEVSATKIS
jgi:hypothetical protein